MKKTLIALAVLASGSAQAGIDLYNENGININLSGAAEVQYADRDWNKKTDGELRIDDADLQLNTTVQLSENLSAVAGMGFAYEAEEVNADELWAGFKGNFGTVTFGRQLLISDDAGIGKDYELGFEQINFVDTAGGSSVKYRFDNDQFYFGASHELNNNDDTAPEITDGVIGVRVNPNLDIRVYGYKGTNLDYQNNVDAKGYNVEAEYVFNNIALAASYGNMDYYASSDDSIKADLEVFDVAASYTLGKNTMAVGYNRAIAQGSIANFNIISNHADNVYANITHKFNNNVRVYTELGYSSMDLEGQHFDNIGYVAGMEVKF